MAALAAHKLNERRSEQRDNANDEQKPKCEKRFAEAKTSGDVVRENDIAPRHNFYEMFAYTIDLPIDKKTLKTYAVEQFDRLSLIAANHRNKRLKKPRAENKRALDSLAAFTHDKPSDVEQLIQN